MSSKLQKTDNPLWVEAYRPRRVSDVILPRAVKANFLKMIEKRMVPNLLLAGGAGMGKTTVAKALFDELEADCYVINGSLDGNIDTLRNDIANFVSTVSFSGGRKYVIIDEADYLTHAVQPALRNFMEEYSRNAGFVLTCNYKDKIIEPLCSRLSVVEFKIPPKEADDLKRQTLTRIVAILESEDVEFDAKVVAEVVQRYYPDVRRMLNELQRHAAEGRIDSGMLASVREASLVELLDMMRDKNFTGVRKWVADNSAGLDNLYRRLYDDVHKYVTPESIPQLVVLMGTYQYRAAFASDAEVNTSAFLAEAMCACTFK